jgi:hypothetical protein
VRSDAAALLAVPKAVALVGNMPALSETLAKALPAGAFPESRLR